MKHCRTLFELRPHEKEEADHHEPITISTGFRSGCNEHADHHEKHGKRLAYANRALGSPHWVCPPGEQSTQHAAAIHGIGWQQVEQPEIYVQPNDAAQ